MATAPGRRESASLGAAPSGAPGPIGVPPEEVPAPGELSVGLNARTHLIWTGDRDRRCFQNRSPSARVGTRPAGALVPRPVGGEQAQAGGWGDPPRCPRAEAGGHGVSRRRVSGWGAQHSRERRCLRKARGRGRPRGCDAPRGEAGPVSHPRGRRAVELHPQSSGCHLKEGAGINCRGLQGIEEMGCGDRTRQGPREATLAGQGRGQGHGGKRGLHGLWGESAARLAGQVCQTQAGTGCL